MYIDLLDRIKEINDAGSNKAQIIPSACNFLSRLAMDADIHVCGLVQIGRKVEERKNKRPTYSDLKDAGAYEEYADLILGLYRDGFYSDQVIDNSIEIIGLKQRQGPTFKEKMNWIGSSITIKEKEDSEESMGLNIHMEPENLEDFDKGF